MRLVIEVSDNDRRAISDYISSLSMDPRPSYSALIRSLLLLAYNGKVSRPLLKETIVAPRPTLNITLKQDESVQKVAANPKAKRTHEEFLKSQGWDQFQPKKGRAK
jgi:hypothetical protein